jgi:hypothetical protein
MLLCKVYFPLPAQARYIGGRLARYISAPYSSFVPRDKLGEFVSRASDVIDYAVPIEFLDGVYPLPNRMFGSVHSFTERIELLEWLSFGLAIIAAFNMLLGLSYDVGAGQTCWLNECPDAEMASVGAIANATPTRRQLRTKSASGGATSGIDGDEVNTSSGTAVSFPREELHFGLGVAQLVCCGLLLLLTIIERSPATIHGHWKVFSKGFNPLRHSRNLAEQLGLWLRAVLPSVMPPLVVYAYFGALYWLRWPELQGMILKVPAAIGAVVALRRTRQYADPPLTVGSLFYVSFYDLCMDSVQVRNGLFFAFAFVGFINTKLYYFVSAQLFRVVTLSSTLDNVVQAVILPAKALVLTGILAVFVIFVFALVAFLDFNAEMDTGIDPLCSDLMECFGYVMHKCSLAASNLLPEASTEGSTYASSEGMKMAMFDLLFFTVVVIVLTNFIFGILIDTFARLREEREEQEDQVDNYCFICSKPRGDWTNPAQVRTSR